MGGEAAALLAAEPPVGLDREGQLGPLAGDEVLQLLRQRAARPEEQPFEGGDGDLEDLGDLLVGAALQLAEDERLALRARDPLQRADEIVDGRAVVVRLVAGHVAVELDLLRPRLVVPPALPDHVVRDRDQPGLGLPRPVAALERAQGVDEGGLRHVLRVGGVPEQGEPVAVDRRRVLAVELVRAPCRAGAGLGGGHTSPDARGSRCRREPTDSLHLVAQVSAWEGSTR